MCSFHRYCVNTWCLGVDVGVNLCYHQSRGKIPQSKKNCRLKKKKLNLWCYSVLLFACQKFWIKLNFSFSNLKLLPQKLKSGWNQQSFISSLKHFNFNYINHYTRIWISRSLRKITLFFTLPLEQWRIFSTPLDTNVI